MKTTQKITGGVYLVINPAQGLDHILPRLERSLRGGLSVVQIWDNWPAEVNKLNFIHEITEKAHAYGVPVLINNEWEVLPQTTLDGVHFDGATDRLPEIQDKVGRAFLKGITCANDLSIVHWANDNGFDYVSFCSLFPSPSANACEIVTKETIQKARKLTNMPLFAAGGITLENMGALKDFPLNGVALISALMKSADPLETTQQFKQHFAHETLSRP